MSHNRAGVANIEGTHPVLNAFILMGYPVVLGEVFDVDAAPLDKNVKADFVMKVEKKIRISGDRIKCALRHEEERGVFEDSLDE